MTPSVEARRVGPAIGAALLLSVAWLHGSASAQSTASRCERPAIDIALDITHVTTHWDVKKNIACEGQVEGALRRNPGYSRDGFLNNFVVSKKAQHGTAGIINSVSYSGFAYAPQQNFTGRDAFEITLDHHLDAGGTQKVTISVDVNVVN